jgi:hypothetical protein
MTARLLLSSDQRIGLFKNKSNLHANKLWHSVDSKSDGYTNEKELCVPFKHSVLSTLVPDPKMAFPLQDNKCT